MSEKTADAMRELNSAKFGTFRELFDKMRALSLEYGGMPMQSLVDAFGTVTGRYNAMFTDNPYTQNQRVKGIATRPANYSKDQVAKMVQAPEGCEQPLRAVERSLEYSAYPLWHMRTVYQNLLTYHSYIAPELTDREDAERDDFWREWKLLEKLRKKLNPKDTAHMLAGQALQEGKVFYVPRVKADKSHNKIDHAFLQQLPSDYVKIVGFNNISKYTVAFNMMYFMQPGTDWRQFGDLFEPYVANFADAVGKPPEGLGTKLVYAAIDMRKVREAADPNVDAYFEKGGYSRGYYQAGEWCYWVTLPADKVFPFEIDDTDRNVLPVFTGLFIDMIQLAQMEQIQLELLQNPLVSLLHGEIPYWDEKNTNTADQYKLSMAGLAMFQTMWAQMLTQNNTSGIGLFAAPFEDMKLESLAEAPGAIEIVAQGYQDTMAKAGLTAIIPTSDEARAGAVQVSLMLESQLPKCIYTCYERMVNAVIPKLNLNYEWKFYMTGDLSSDEKRKKELKEEMTLGILSAALEYNAICDRSILDDIAWSDAVDASGLIKKRKPLVTSFNQSAKSVGRPPAEDAGSSDGHEQDADGAEE